MGLFTPEERRSIAVRALEDQIEAVKREQAELTAATALMFKRRRHLLNLSTAILCVWILVLVGLVAALGGLVIALITGSSFQQILPWVAGIGATTLAAEVCSWGSGAALGKAIRIGEAWRARLPRE